MSGVDGRVSEKGNGEELVVGGFNGKKSIASIKGINEDGKEEWFVEDMPNDLVLLCANEYAKDGVVILFGDDGMVIRLKGDDEKELRNWIEKYPVEKMLVVKNATYRVIDKEETEVEAMVANTYFNTKVNVSDGEERILAYMLMGFGWDTLWGGVNDGSIKGFHPGLTKELLNKFAKKWGKSPDILQMAHPNITGNMKGYMSEREEILEVGYIQADFMSYDFNDPNLGKMIEDRVGGRRRKKLQTIGGAIAGFVAVDEYSGFVYGRLVKSMASPMQLIVELFGEYEKCGHHVKSFAADEGISSSSDCRVMTTEVERYLIQKRCKLVKADPYNHQNGTPKVERMIQTIKNRMRMAFQYGLSNQNIERLGYSRVGIMKLWGEVFMWAIEVENMKRSRGNTIKSKWEVFTGQVPNIQDRRMLPIFSVIKVHRVEGKTRTDASEGGYYQYGLYCGPCTFGKGVIRAAVVQKGVISILRTSKYKGVSDGGDAMQYVNVNGGIELVIRDQIENLNVSASGNRSSSGGEISEVDDQEGELIESESEVINEESQIVELRKNEEKVVESFDIGKNEENVEMEEEMNKKEFYGRSTRFRGKKHVPVYSALDWSKFEEENMMYDTWKNEVLIIGEEEDEDIGREESIREVGIDAYVVVKVAVPKNFKLALTDPIWGEAARSEFNTLTTVMGTLIKIRKEDAYMLRQGGADRVILFPIYEKKIKEGQEILKVRLVCNGRTQFGAGQTYSPTPTRCEFFILLHIIAALRWYFVHLDETRAFLSARYSGKKKVIAQVSGMDESFDILGALYGLRTSPRDYRMAVLKRLKEMGFRQAQTSSCIFTNCKGVVVFDFVDDFVMGGKDKVEVEEVVNQYRTLATTTEPIWDPQIVLGHELTRNLERREITVSLKGKIMEMVDEWMDYGVVKRNVPLAKEDYLVKDSDFEEMGVMAEFLNDDERRLYQKIVGQCIWIHGVRVDISFAISYITGYTFKPRKHHFTVAIRLVGYLWETVNKALVLGGDLNVRAYSDSSHGTSKEGRSICGSIIKFSEGAGAILAKTAVSLYVRLSSFEAEMEAMNITVKLMNWVLKVKEDIIGRVTDIPVVYGDNRAMIDFVKEDGEAKGIRHIELKMYYVREEFRKGRFDLEFMSGVRIPADLLTKVGSSKDFGVFREYILGNLENKVMMDTGGVGCNDGLPV